MKKIFAILTLIISLTSKAQYPITQNLGNASTRVTVPANGALQANLINATYADTTAANLSYIKYYAGAQIFTTSDASFWLRSLGATAWIKVKGENIYNSDGTLTGARILTGNYQPLTFDGLGGFDVTSFNGGILFQSSSGGKASTISISDSIKLLPSLGNLVIDSLNSGSSTDSILTWNPSNGRVKKINSLSVNGINIYNSDGTLTGDRLVNLDNNLLEIGNGGMTFYKGNNSSVNSVLNIDDNIISIKNASSNNSIKVEYDTLRFEPYKGNFKIDSLNSGSSTDSVLTWNASNGQVKKKDVTSLNIKNIYNSDGTLTGDRTFDGGNHSLSATNFSDFTVLAQNGTNNTGVFGDGADLDLYGARIGGESLIRVKSDSIMINPHLGKLKIDTLNSGVSTDSVMVWKKSNGLVGIRSVSSLIGGNAAFASYYDTTTQTALANQTKAMKFSTLDIDGTAGFTKLGDTAFRASNKGIYNIQFSGEVHRTAGGTKEQIYIWFRKNGTDIPWSNTTITLENNGDKAVASWNYFISLNANDDFQIMWRPTSAAIELLKNTSTPGIPEIPSAIMTVQKIN